MGVYCILAVVARDARAPQGHNWSYNQLKAALLLKPPSPLLLILWSFACASHCKYANLNSCTWEHTLNTWREAAGTSSLLVAVCQLNSGHLGSALGHLQPSWVVNHAKIYAINLNVKI